MNNGQDANRDRAALAFIALMAAAAIGAAWIIRSPAGDPNHLIGGYNATPDATPTTCWFGLVRGPSETWERLDLDKIDGGNSIALAKSCFAVPEKCVGVDGGVLVLRDAGSTPAPCVVTDAGTYCPDASTPWAVYEDICATDVQVLPSGIEYTSADEWFRPYKPGEAVFEVWSNGHPAAPWRCACGAQGAQDAGVCEAFDPVFGKKEETLSSMEGATVIGRRVLDGGVWTPVPRERLHEVLQPGQHRGNCTPMPCSSWGEPEALPPACRVAECEGRACGRGRGGGQCGPDFAIDDAGQPITCVGNQWARECDPDWECGPGKWLATCGQCAPGFVCRGHKCRATKVDVDGGI